MLLSLAIHVSLTLLAQAASHIQNPSPGDGHRRQNISFKYLVEAVTSLLGGDGAAPSLLGYLQGKIGKPQEFDYIVVGGGAAGTVICYRLAEAGYDVALIEIGEYHEYSKPTFGSIPGLGTVFAAASALTQFNWADWALYAEPHDSTGGRKIHIPQGKGIGGSSSLNYMLYGTPPRSFFDKWADMVQDESYRSDNFQQFYARSVTTRAATNRTHWAGAWLRNGTYGFDNTDGPIQLGYSKFISPWTQWLKRGLEATGFRPLVGDEPSNLPFYLQPQLTVRPDGGSKSTASEFILKAKLTNLARLRVFTNTEVTKIFFEKSTATGVYVASFGNESLIKATKEVILCAGAVKSPHLLMVSGIGPEDVLKQQNITTISSLRGVGQNLQDHVYFGVSYPVAVETTDASVTNIDGFNKSLRRYKESANGILSSNGLEFLAFEKLPQQYRHFSAQTNAHLSKIGRDWPEVEYISANGYIGSYQTDLFQSFNGTNHATILATLSAPASRGNITIQAANISQPPVISPNWLESKPDEEVSIALIRRARDIFRSPALKSIRLGDESWPGADVQTDQQILGMVRRSFFTPGHLAGTCRMGQRDDEAAVVDNAARVLGVQGLRVVDASSLPILPPGHPIATIYAFAEKIADSIIREQIGIT